MLTCVNLKVAPGMTLISRKMRPPPAVMIAAERRAAQMYEIMLERKWGRWKWSVCDSGGKVIVVGRENSRTAARYKAARALFELLLSSRPCDLHEPRRNERL